MAQKLLGGSAQSWSSVSFAELVHGTTGRLGEQAMSILIIRVPITRISLAGTDRMSLSRAPAPEDLVELSLTSSSQDEVVSALEDAANNKFPFLVALPAGMDILLPPLMPFIEEDPMGVLVMQLGHRMTASEGHFNGHYGIGAINLITSSLGTALSEADESIDSASRALAKALTAISRILPFLRDVLSRQPETLKLVRDAARVMELDNVLEHLAARLIVMETPDAEQTLDMILTALRRVGRRRLRASVEAAEALRAEDIHRRWVERSMLGRSPARQADVMDGARSGRWPLAMARTGSWRDAPSPDAPVAWARGARDAASATRLDGGRPHSRRSRDGPPHHGRRDMGSASWRDRAMAAEPMAWPAKHPLKMLTGSKKSLPPLLTPERKAVLQRAVAGPALSDTPGTMVFVVLVSVLVRWMRSDRSRLKGQLVAESARAALMSACTSPATESTITDDADEEEVEEVEAETEAVAVAEPEAESRLEPEAGADAHCTFPAASEIANSLRAIQAQIRLMPKALATGPEQDVWQLVRLLSSARVPLFDLEDARAAELAKIAAELRAATAMVAVPEPAPEAAPTITAGTEAAATTSASASELATSGAGSGPSSENPRSAWSTASSFGTHLAAQRRAEALVQKRRSEARREEVMASAGEAAEALALASGQSAAEAAAAGRVAAGAVARTLGRGEARATTVELSKRVHELTTERAREILDATIGSEMRRMPGCGVESLYPNRCAASSVVKRLLETLPIHPEVPHIADNRRRVCRVTAIDQSAGWRAAAEADASSDAVAGAASPSGGSLETADVVLVPCRIGEVTGLVFDAPGEYCISYQPLGFLCDAKGRRSSHLMSYASASRASERRRPFVTVGSGAAASSKRGDGAQLWVDAEASGGVLHLRWSPFSEDELSLSPAMLESFGRRHKPGTRGVLRGRLEITGDCSDQSMLLFASADETPRITLAWLSCSVSVTYTAGASGDGPPESAAASSSDASVRSASGE